MGTNQRESGVIRLKKHTLSLDIETVCNVQGCKYYGKVDGDDADFPHSLSPWHNRITVVGVTDGADLNFVTRTLHGLEVFLGSLDDYEVGGQNFKFDLLNLLVHGVEIPMEKWTWDSQLAAYVLTDKIPDAWLEDYEAIRRTLPTKHRKAGKHSLKTLATYFLGVDPFWETEDKDNDEYVLKDARYALQLRNVLETRLKELNQYEFYKEKQLNWAKMLLRAELRGIKIDLKELEAVERETSLTAQMLEAKIQGQWYKAHQAYKELKQKSIVDKYLAMANAALVKSKKKDDAEVKDRILRKYHELCNQALVKTNTSFNLQSPDQVLWLLRDYLGYDVRGFDGEEGTGKEILQRLADEGKEDVRTFLDYRSEKKILSSFIPQYKALAVDGVIHPIFNCSSTATGRLSCQLPNLQQVPPKLRKLFVPREGYTFIGFDAASIEAKLIAYYSGDPVLYDIISSGASIHNFNTKVFFGLEETSLEDIPKQYPVHRAATKNVSFALFYHAGANRIRETFAAKGFFFNKNECTTMHRRFLNAFSVAMDYAKTIVAHLEDGGILTNLLGRPVAVQDPQAAYMTGFNSLVQGSGSDLNTDGAYRATEIYDGNNLDSHLLALVHDFALFEVPTQFAERAEQILIEKMTDTELQTVNGPIPLTVEGGRMSRWEK